MISATTTSASAENTSQAQLAKNSANEATEAVKTANVKSGTSTPAVKKPDPQDTVALSAGAKRTLAQAEAGRAVVQLLQKRLDGDGRGADGKQTNTSLDAQALLDIINGDGAASVPVKAIDLDLTVPLNPKDGFQTTSARNDGVKSRQAFEAHVYEMNKDAYERAWKHPGLAAFAQSVANKTLTIIPWSEASDEMKATVSVARGLYTDTGEGSETKHDPEKLHEVGPQKYTTITVDPTYGVFFMSFGGVKD